MNKERLAALCDLDGVSGYEENVREYILSELGKSTAPKTVNVDKMGNILVHLQGKSKGKLRLLFDAHMDEVGIIVTSITDDGFLLFDTVGGIDKQSLFGKRIRFGSTTGVIGGKAIHQCLKEESKMIPKIDSMIVDIGATDRETAEKRVCPGTVGTFDTAFATFGENRFMGKAIDNRMGCALLLELAEKQPPADIWLSFSVQEEVGLRGAKTVAEQVKPDISIVVDSTTAADIAGNNEQQAVCRVGCGAVVYYADKQTLYDNNVYRTLKRIAAENGISTQTKTRIAGGTNAAVIQRSGCGVQLGAVSLPCRYIHSPIGVAEWSDAEAMEDLLKAVVERAEYDF